MSLAQGNNTPTRPRIEPGSPDPESDALTTRPVRSEMLYFLVEDTLIVYVQFMIGFKRKTSSLWEKSFEKIQNITFQIAFLNA